MRHRLLKRRSSPAQAGASVIEFALVLLVFLTFFLGLIDLTRLLYTFHAAQEAARVGARYAAVCDDTTRSADVRTVMQRLVPGTGAQRINPCGHRLDTLARPRQDQSGAVTLQPRVPVGMPEPRRQMLHVPLKPLARAHRSSHTGRRCAYSALKLMT